MTVRIEDYAQLSPLLAGELKPGVLTNTLLKKEDYLREIAAGSLFAEKFPGGLLLLRRREGYQRLNFYLQRGASLPPLSFSLPTVLEIASRPRDQALRDSEVLWEQAGFRPLFSRQRMARPEGLSPLPGPEGLSAHVAAEEELSTLERLLQECFDPLAGCLPTREELREDLQNGNVISLPGGILHMGKAPGGTELRHLAVTPSLRRQGAAQALFAAYLLHTENRASRVWVRTDNPPALGFYEKNGYTCDGWTSRVYTAGKEM